MPDLSPPPERGLYTTAEAARYAKTSPQTATRWLRGYVYPTKLGPRRSRRLTSREPPGRLLSFYDLVEIAIVGAVRRAGVTMPDLRRALSSVDELYGLQRPMLVQRFQTDGRHVFISDPGDPRVLVNLSRHGQTAWRYVREVLRDLDYDNEIVSRFWPVGRNRPILIDPTVSFGQPIVDGVGVPTRVIAARFGAREPLRDVAADLSVPLDAAEDALRFEGVFPALAA